MKSGHKEAHVTIFPKKRVITKDKYSHKIESHVTLFSFYSTPPILRQWAQHAAPTDEAVPVQFAPL